MVEHHEDHRDAQEDQHDTHRLIGVPGNEKIFRSDQVRSGQFSSVQVRSGQVRSNKTSSPLLEIGQETKLDNTLSIWLGIQFRQRYTHKKERKLKQIVNIFGLAGP